MPETVKVANMRKIAEKPDTRKVKEAFERYEGKKETTVIHHQREHIGASFVEGVSCRHSWMPLRAEDVIKQMEAVYEETGIAEQIEFCKKCGSTCLRESGQIWAYDATFDVIEGKFRRFDQYER
jgi:hypothetical protein